MALEEPACAHVVRAEDADPAARRMPARHLGPHGVHQADDGHDGLGLDFLDEHLTLETRQEHGVELVFLEAAHRVEGPDFQGGQRIDSRRARRRAAAVKPREHDLRGFVAEPRHQRRGEAREECVRSRTIDKTITPVFRLAVHVLLQFKGFHEKLAPRVSGLGDEPCGRRDASYSCARKKAGCGILFRGRPGNDRRCGRRCRRPAIRGYFSNLGLIRFSNEKMVSQCSCVSSLRSLTTTSCSDLPVRWHSRAISAHCL